MKEQLENNFGFDEALADMDLNVHAALSGLNEDVETKKNHPRMIPVEMWMNDFLENSEKIIFTEAEIEDVRGNLELANKIIQLRLEGSEANDEISELKLITQKALKNYMDGGHENRQRLIHQVLEKSLSHASLTLDRRSERRLPRLLKESMKYQNSKIEERKSSVRNFIQKKLEAGTLNFVDKDLIKENASDIFYGKSVFDNAKIENFFSQENVSEVLPTKSEIKLFLDEWETELFVWEDVNAAWLTNRDLELACRMRKIETRKQGLKSHIDDYYMGFNWNIDGSFNVLGKDFEEEMKKQQKLLQQMLRGLDNID